MPQVIELSLKIDQQNCSQKPSRLLALHSGLSQAKIKDAMQKGAVWLLRGQSKKRLRRASKILLVGDVLELYYNAEILNQNVPEPDLIHDAGDYSVWFKPYGLYCQGSRWGDFANISRWVEKYFSEQPQKQKALNQEAQQSSQRPVHLVHRLDKATSGLILLCHSKNAAKLFSQMFAKQQVKKHYQALVHGDFSAVPQNHRVNLPIDGKTACSVFSFVDFIDGKSLVDVQLLTGRKHQIRKHLRALNFPIVGDRLYGEANDSAPDLQLQAVTLSFLCPIEQQPCSFHVESSRRLSLSKN